MAENWHMMKDEPRSEVMVRAWRQSEHKPASIFFGKSLTGQA
jgi:hypothetical protein